MATIMAFFKDLERYGIYKDSQFILSIPQELLRELIDRWKEIEKKDNSPKEENKMSFGEACTSSQTEISDEEIEMAALHNEPRITRRAFKSGAKWYREQLNNLKLK